MSNTKHFAKGSAKPVLPNDGKLRLFSMRFCPYAQRVHLVLDAKNIPYHVVNINLTEKPEWYFNINPIGKVPAIELVNEPGSPFLVESLVICEYLDEKYPEKALYSKNPLTKAQDNLWIQKFSELTTPFYQLMLLSGDQDQAIVNFSNSLNAYENELKRRNTPFFGGNEPNILDYMIWPWFERIPALKHLVGDKVSFDTQSHPALVAWWNLFSKDSAVQKSFVTGDIHITYRNSRISGNTNYDLLVE